LQRGVARALLRVTNASDRALAFAWRLGASGPTGEGGSVSAAAMAGGRLAVRPECGVVGPGRAALCQVVFEAGSMALLLEAEIRCEVWRAGEDEARAAAEAEAGAESASDFSVSEAGTRCRGSERASAGDGLGGGVGLAGEWERRAAQAEEGGELLEDDVTEEIIAVHPARWASTGCRGCSGAWAAALPRKGG
jgi:hypothetical protein